VVAEEVRALALRSAKALRTTATPIERGMESVERGVALNDEVLASLEDTVRTFALSDSRSQSAAVNSSRKAGTGSAKVTNARPSAPPQVK